MREAQKGSQAGAPPQAAAWWRPVLALALPAVASGLYRARLYCEGGTARSLLLIVLRALGGVMVAVAVVHLLRRLRLVTWPLVLPAAYVLWPQRDPRLALAVGVVTLVAFVLTQRRAWRLPGYLAELAVGLAALALYVGTLAPSVQPADAGEFQLVASVLGIAHPPGYPLYTMLGKAFTLLPFGDAAWRVNLFAAVCAAATLAVLARAVREATGSAAAAVVAALALGLAPTFWAQGTYANIRSLTALLAALCLYWLLRYGRRRDGRDLVAFAVSFGLAVTHHSTLALLGLPFAGYLVAVDPRLPLQPRRWARPALGFVAAFALLLYLPLRSAMSPAFDTPSVRTAAGFVQHVLALGFQGDFLYFLGKPEMGQRVGVLADIFRLEFGTPLWLGAIALGLYAGRCWPRRLLLWGGVALVNALAAITYRAPQTVEYLIPAYVALALGLGLGLGSLLSSGPAPAHSWVPAGPARQATVAILGGIAAWLALANGLAAGPSFVALHHDLSTREQAETLLQEAPPGTLILSNWHQATPLWYLQAVEGERPDVTVTYVYPEGATPNGEVWARRISEAAPEHPVLVTNWFGEYADLPYAVTPQPEGWLLGAAGTAPPAGLSGEPALFADRIELLGARLEEGEAEPGKTVSVLLVWRAPTLLDRDYTWFVHLVGPDGIAGQADLTYRPDEAPPGETVVSACEFPLRPDASPGEYRLIAGVYFTLPEGGWQRLQTAAGEEAVGLGLVQVQPRGDAPVTAQPLAVSWADDSRLEGVDYDDSIPGQRRVYLHWYRPADAQDLEVTLLREGQTLARVQVAGGPRGYRSVACDLPPGAAPLSLTATVGGVSLPSLGAWNRPRQAPVSLPVRPAGSRYLDFGGQVVLTSARWWPETPAPGAPLLAELEFMAQRPLVADYSISLALAGEGWGAQHDGTPALGAIPTLKWLAGWRVRDVRRLEVPATASGSASLGLSVYDAFTLRALPVGDDRLARLGQGTQALLWEGALP